MGETEVSMAVAAVGRMKDRACRQLADEYLKRLSRYGSIEELEVPDLPEPAGSNARDGAALSRQEEQVRLREGEALLRRLRDGDWVIALTPTGRKLDSPGFAAHLAELRNRGAGRIVFLIGGSLGLGQNVLKRAQEEISLSDLTFPHQLARVILLEQLYRAEKILAGERYHK